MKAPLDAAADALNRELASNIISGPLCAVAVEARHLGAVLCAPGLRNADGDSQFPSSTLRVAFVRLVTALEQCANEFTSGNLQERLALDPRTVLEPAIAALEETEPEASGKATNVGDFGRCGMPCPERLV